MSSILAPGNVAVVTGAGGGIGLAAARFYASHGMHVVLIDRNEVGLRAALESVRGIAGGGDVLSFALDAGDVDDVERMRDDVLRRFREVHVLMANHGIRSSVGTFSDSQSLKEVHSLWNDIINVNLLSILLVVQAFVPSMAKQPSESVIIATGSKLGIDNRPKGKPGYNVSKAGLKAYTEQLAHDLRNTPGCRCSAHLFIPGWTWTGLATAAPELGNSAVSKMLPGMWTPELTIEYMAGKIFHERVFYAVCPDGEVSSVQDKVDLGWTLNDIVEGRPALSRWHPDYTPKYEVFLQSQLEAAGQVD